MWPTVTLEEIGQWGSGGTPLVSRREYYDGDVPWLIIEDLNDGVVRTSKRFITQLGLENSSAKVVEPGALLIAMYGSIGKLGIAGMACATNQAIAFCRCYTDKISAKFLFYYLLASRSTLTHAGRGGTQQNISQEILKAFPVPLPPLQEQHRIAALLDKADRLRRSRRYAQELSNSVLQSVFLEMFRSKKSHTWTFETIEYLAKEGQNAIRTGPFGSQLLHSEFTDHGIAVLGIDNAVQNRFTWDKRRFVSKEKYDQLKRYTVYPGDVLITIMGTCGRCAVVPDNIPPAINTKHLCCITLDQRKCLPIYLQACFLTHPFVLSQLGISERGAVMPGLNMGIIKDLKIPIPPLSLQEEFVHAVRRWDSLRVQQAEAERQAEHFFQTLLHRAFSAVAGTL